MMRNVMTPDVRCGGKGDRNHTGHGERRDQHPRPVGRVEGPQIHRQEHRSDETDILGGHRDVKGHHHRGRRDRSHGGEHDVFRLDRELRQCRQPEKDGDDAARRIAVGDVAAHREQGEHHAVCIEKRRGAQIDSQQPHSLLAPDADTGPGERAQPIHDANLPVNELIVNRPRVGPAGLRSGKFYTRPNTESGFDFYRNPYR